MLDNRICIKGITKKFDYILTDVELFHVKGSIVVATTKKIRFEKNHRYELASAKKTEGIIFKFMGNLKPEVDGITNLKYYRFALLVKGKVNYINKNEYDIFIDYFKCKKPRLFKSI